MATDPDPDIAERAAPSPVSPLARHRVQLEQASGSHNEDLAWIVREFKERIGACGVAVTIHYADSRSAEIEIEDSSGGPSGASLRGLRWMRGDASPEGGPAVSWCEPAADFPWHSLVMDMASNHCSRVVITAFFPQASFADPDVKEFVARRFQPVLTGYFKLWLLHRSTSRRLQTLVAALADVDFGVVVLDRDAKIVFENPTAAKILEEGKALRRCRGSICANGITESISLRVAIDEALAGTLKGRSSSAIFVKAPRNAAPLAVTVSTVEHVGPGEHDPAVIVHVFDPAVSLDQTIGPVCDWYRLSRTETRLVKSLVAGRSVPDIAAQEDIKADTVRTYLKSVFRKTNSKSQADLVRVMMTSAVRLLSTGKSTKSCKR